MKMLTMIMVECPTCGEMILFEKRPRLSQFVECSFCEEELEVVDLDPVQLDWPLGEDDFNYDEDYEYIEDD